MERELSNEAETEKNRGCLINDKGGIVEEERSWANLPNEILTEIISRIFGSDRVVFRCVCRSWKPVTPFKTNKKLPLNNNTTSTSCLSGTYLMYPNGKKIISPIYNECHQANLFRVPGAIVHAAKDGWFLMTTLQPLKQIFLFHPLTNTKEDLPELPPEALPRAAYISAPPTPPNWTVICVTRHAVPKIAIWAIKCGEKSWSRREFERAEWFHFFMDGSSAVVCNGLYYFLGEHAKLLIHDPKKKSFSLHEAPESIICKQLRAKDAQSYLLESDGKVLAVFVSFDGSVIRVCQWNVYKKTWDELKTLGDKILYVSRSSSICERATVNGTGNKIYFPRLMDDDYCLFYSLSTKKYHTFVPGSSYRSFNGLKYPRDPTWIKL